MVLKGNIKGRAEYLGKGQITDNPLFNVGVGKFEAWLEGSQQRGLVYGGPGSGKTFLLRHFADSAGIVHYTLDKETYEMKHLSSPRGDEKIVVCDDANYALKAARIRELRGERGIVNEVVERILGLETEAEKSGQRFLLASTENIGTLASRIKDPETRTKFVRRFADVCTHYDVGALKYAGLPPIIEIEHLDNVIEREFDPNAKHEGFRISGAERELELIVRESFGMKNIPFLWKYNWEFESQDRKTKKWVMDHDSMFIIDLKLLNSFDAISHLNIGWKLNSYMYLSTLRKLYLAQSELGRISINSINRYLDKIPASSRLPVPISRAIPESKLPNDEWHFTTDSRPLGTIKFVLDTIYREAMHDTLSTARELFSAPTDQEAEAVLLGTAIAAE
ncbi:MAG: ATP-binding protein [Candidatus Aenigmarchaeota archaeon]|nr:ATP-binding protein [Candidatus Aenigmarchaeota archaeon]